MSSTLSVLGHGLHIPRPPRSMRTAGRRLGRRRGMAREAMLTFGLGLAVAWMLAEAALWFGGYS